MQVVGRSVVEGDPDQLGHLLLNLLLNAAESMPSGGGRLEATLTQVRLSREQANRLRVNEGEYVELKVIDQGLGIPEEQLERAFEPFFTTKSGQGRSGLGLSMVYGAVRDHGGAVTLASRLGVGTTATCWLPLGAGEPESVREPHADPVPTERRSILVIDDEPLMLRAVTRMIKSIGFVPLTANGGLDGLELYATHREQIALVLLDLAMPGLDGSETFKRLLKLDPNVIVAIASGFPQDQDADALLAVGARAFLQKPYDRNELGALVSQLQIPAS